jgi:threonine dehydrogenase-like Zn-dependent dehydrogenase
MPTAKTCIKDGPGRVALADLELRAPGPGEALIRTTLSTLCGSDLHVIDEIDRMPAGLPQGHEAVGIVEAIGDGVTRLKPGDRVVASCVVGCGHCALCDTGELQLCRTYNFPFNILFGCQSEAFIARSADLNLARIPDGMPDTAAIFAADVLSTGFAALERAQLKHGQSVAVFAQGPVGLCATMAAKHLGAARIIAVEAIPERAAMARRMGADEVIPPADAPDNIRALTGGLGVDVAVEAVGKPAAFEACQRSIRVGGVVSIVGVYTGVPALQLPVTSTFFHHTTVTSYCPGGTERLQYLLGLMERGAIDPTPLLTHAMGLRDIGAAYDLFRSRRDGVLKIAITP